MEDGVLFESRERDGQASHQAAIGVLDVFAQAAQVPFDRLSAARLLGEATRTIPGDDANAWSRRLMEVGESLDLRIRTVESTLAEVLLFPQHGIPVATCRDAGSGQLTWLLITAVRGTQVQVVQTTDLARSRWVSQKALFKLLGIQGPAAMVRWVIGQAALACGKAAGQHEGGRLRTPSPLTRLLQLVRPERSDLGALVVFAVVVGVLALASPIAIEALVNTVAFGQYLQPVIVLALILFTFLGFAAAIRGLITYVVEIIQRRLFVRVVEDLAYRLPRVETAALDGRYGPELTNRFFDIVTVQKVVASLLVDGLAIVLQTGIGMMVLAFYHPFLLGFDVVLLTMIGVALFGLGRGAVKSAIKESKMKYAMAAWLQELTRSPTAFKFHGGTQLAIDRADKLAVDYLDARKKHFRIVLRQILFALGLQAVAATILLGLGGWLVLQGELTLGQLVAAELIVMTIVGSFAKIGKHMENFYDLLASVDKLGALFDLPVESHNKLFHLRDGLPATVRAEQVNYGYGEHSVLNGLSLTIESGERVAIVGPPGSGKSTLMELLSGLRAPDGGHIELDEIDLRELRPDSLRDQVSLARGVEIFAGTIAENVHLHRPQISARDIRDALNVVGLRESILRLPDGLQTVLQPDGRPLSSSQSQRLMLARAIVGQPRLLLIDATLDALPADVLEPLLAQLFGRDRSTTVLVVTARREILARCDRVISLPAWTADDSAARGNSKS